MRRVANATKNSFLTWHPGAVRYFQEKGKPVRIVHKGDAIKCPAGVEHWHAAAPKSTFAYIAVTPTQKGKTIWLKPVTDEEYNSAK